MPMPWESVTGARPQPACRPQRASGAPTGSSLPSRDGEPALELILGATGVGKTARSVQRARELKAPVVTADRVQTIPALAIGSGRLTRAEAAAGPERRYLADRALAQGPLPADEALGQLTRLVAELLEAHRTVVIEGGSCSLLRLISTRSEWPRGRDVHIEYLTTPDDDRYHRQVRERVEGMLGVDDPTRRTLLDELGEAWVDTRHRPVLESITGYREAVRYCSQQQLDPADLLQHGHEHAAHLVSPITQAHLRYASAQRLIMGRALRRLRARGYTVCRRPAAAVHTTSEELT